MLTISIVYIFCFFFVFVFVIFFYVGTHLARGYSSGTHGIITGTHTCTHIQLHTTQLEGITNNQVVLFIYTHTLCGQWQHFFKFFRGAGLGLNPEHPIALAQHHH